jgi:hypothetical protein
MAEKEKTTIHARREREGRNTEKKILRKGDAVERDAEEGEIRAAKKRKMKLKVEGDEGEKGKKGTQEKRKMTCRRKRKIR